MTNPYTPMPQQPAGGLSGGAREREFLIEESLSHLEDGIR